MYFFGILLFLIRHKSHADQYFSSIGDVGDLNKLKAFAIGEWDTLLLSVVLLLAYFFLTKDSTRWREHAEKCFSVQAMPRRAWRLVRGRWVIVWVVMCNIPTFFSLAWFADNVLVFSVLFLIHHVNAVLWLRAFRKNVQFFFTESAFLPPDADPQKPFILERRSVMKHFLCATWNVRREALAAMGYGIAVLLALAHRDWFAFPYIAPFPVIVAAEGMNQFLYYKERRRRDRDLGDIDGREESYFEILS